MKNKKIIGWLQLLVVVAFGISVFVQATDSDMILGLLIMIGAFSVLQAIRNIIEE